MSRHTRHDTEQESGNVVPLRTDVLGDLDTFKVQFRQQVMCDAKLSGAASKCAWHLADYSTMRTSARRYAEERVVIVFPSLADLAEKTGFSVPTVARGLAECARRKHVVRVKRGGGFSGNSEYRLRLRDPG